MNMNNARSFVNTKRTIQSLPPDIIDNIAIFLDNRSLERFGNATNEAIKARTNLFKSSELDNSSLKHQWYNLHNYLEANNCHINSIVCASCCLAVGGIVSVASFATGLKACAITIKTTLLAGASTYLLATCEEKILNFTKKDRTALSKEERLLQIRSSIENILKNMVTSAADLPKLNAKLENIEEPSKCLQSIIEAVDQLSTPKYQNNRSDNQLISIGLILFEYNKDEWAHPLQDISQSINLRNSVKEPRTFLMFIIKVYDRLSSATKNEIDIANAIVNNNEAEEDEKNNARQVLETMEYNKSLAVRQLIHIGLTLQKYEWENDLFNLFDTFNEISSLSIVNYIFDLIKSDDDGAREHNNQFGELVIENIENFRRSFDSSADQTMRWTAFQDHYRQHLHQYQSLRRNDMER